MDYLSRVKRYLNQKTKEPPIYYKCRKCGYKTSHRNHREPLGASKIIKIEVVRECSYCEDLPPNHPLIAS